jgi:hypothetical protein
MWYYFSIHTHKKNVFDFDTLNVILIFMSVMVTLMSVKRHSWVCKTPQWVWFRHSIIYQQKKLSIILFKNTLINTKNLWRFKRQVFGHIKNFELQYVFQIENVLYSTKKIIHFKIKWKHNIFNFNDCIE